MSPPSLEEPTTTTEAPPAAPAKASKDTQASDEALPPLSAADFEIFNRLADTMEIPHSHFRSVWRTLYASVSASSPAEQLDTEDWVYRASRLITMLNGHHRLEEEHIFPIIAERMPAFRPDSALHAQHAVIHDGVEALQSYTQAVHRGEREFKNAEVREIMDGFGETLWAHLAREVEELGADRMRRVWSKQEMPRLPM